MRSATVATFDQGFQTYTEQRQSQWEQVAELGAARNAGKAYHERLREVYRHIIPPGQRVLEIGCGDAGLLAAVEPSRGVGIDFSPQFIERARQRHPELTLIEADAHTFRLDETFDYVILSNLVNDLWDVQAVLENVASVCTPQTRLVIDSYSHLWELPLTLAQKLKLSRPRLYQNWLTSPDIHNLLRLAGFELINSGHEVLFPLPVPVLNPLLNRFGAKLPLLSQLALSNFYVARLQAEPPTDAPPIVSVIVPARNEAGNIENIFLRTPEMGAGTELVFVEGHSRDNTYEVIETMIAAYPHRRAQLHRQTGVGKGDAVRLGFEQAAGSILMILDADLTVPPEDLPRFYRALYNGSGDFINGVRLVYPMEDEAMRVLNFLGNKAFSLAFSWLLGQPIKDTLCGTKALRRSHYDLISANRAYFGDFDPFGDFDLLLGAAKQNLKLIEIPIRYRQRTYGSTNIQRWKHGWLLIRMVLFAARRIKFV